MRGQLQSRRILLDVELAYTHTHMHVVVGGVKQISFSCKARNTSKSKAAEVNRKRQKCFDGDLLFLFLFLFGLQETCKSIKGEFLWIVSPLLQKQQRGVASCLTFGKNLSITLGA